MRAAAQKKIGRPRGTGVAKHGHLHEAAARLREVRCRAGLTQAELARRANLFRQTLSYWETGVHEPLLCGLRTICEALGCPEMPAPQVAEYILWGTGPLAGAGE